MGAWSGELEIVHEDGLVVFRESYLATARDGGWGAGCVAGQCLGRINVGEEVLAVDGAPEGRYLVHYRFAGLAIGRLTVTAIVEGPQHAGDEPAATWPVGSLDAGAPEAATTAVQVYGSAGWIVGTDPADPLDGSPLVDGSWLGRTDMFRAPPGTVALQVSGGFPRAGAWSGTIEILSESGDVVYSRGCLLGRSDPYLGSECFPLSRPGNPAGPGNYTVAFHVAGAVYVDMSVQAVVEG